MNKNNILASALVLLAVGSVALIESSVGIALSSVVGKAVWYLPYAALVGAARCHSLA